MAATAAQVQVVVASIVSQIPAHASVATLSADVLTLLNKLDADVIATATFATQIADKNVIATKAAKH
jgi:hypothetical protein